MTPHIVMIAGEASGDVMGAEALSALKKTGDYKITGVGGKAMLAEGLVPIFPIDEFNIIGLSQAIGGYSRLKRRAAQLIEHVLAMRPDLIVLIDNKEFSMRFGRALKKAMAKAGWSVPIVQLVAPTVWAWGRWRAKQLSESVDHVLCLFPFECAYFTPHGLDAVAVGHPSFFSKRLSFTQARESLGIPQSDKVLMLLPGSRRREIKLLLPNMLAAASRLKKQNPNLRIILPPAESVAEMIVDMAAGCDDVEVLESGQANLVMPAGDFALMCSGTITMEAALSGLAGHVYYRLNPFETLIARILVKSDKVVLANVLSGQEIYQYRLNRQASVNHMVKATQAGLYENQRPKILALMQPILDQVSTLGAGDFGDNVAAQLRRILNVC